MTNHPNAIAWWNTLSLADKAYWYERYLLDPKKSDELSYKKELYCYQTMLWERCDNGSC